MMPGVSIVQACDALEGTHTGPSATAAGSGTAALQWSMAAEPQAFFIHDDSSDEDTAVEPPLQLAVIPPPDDPAARISLKRAAPGLGAPWIAAEAAQISLSTAGAPRGDAYCM